MQRVLVTGATGFIGRHCLPLLVKKGYEIHATHSKDTLEVAAPDIYWHKTNLLDSTQVLELLKGIKPTHLLHLAWYVVPGKCWNSEENLRWVGASLDLLHAFSQHGGQRVVMAGTCAEYDWRHGYCCESVTPLAPTSLYGISKHSLQIMLAAYVKQKGLSSSWGRIFFVYGPHEHPNRLVSSVIRSLLNGKHANCSHGNQIRDYLCVLDVAGAFVALLQSDIQGPVNIASGNPVRLKKIVHTIAKKLKRPDSLRLGALPVAEDEPSLLVADITRLSNEVSWQPRYNLNQGLEITISWWKDQLNHHRLRLT